MNDGTREYRGMNSVVRQDMAAFLHRLYYILYPERVGEDSVYVALPQLTLHTKPETTPRSQLRPVHVRAHLHLRRLNVRAGQLEPRRVRR